MQVFYLIFMGRCIFVSHLHRVRIIHISSKHATKNIDWIICCLHFITVLVTYSGTWETPVESTIILNLIEGSTVIYHILFD